MAITYLAKAPAQSNKEKSQTASEHDIKTLNVAGSRGSKEPLVAAFVKQVLEEAFYLRVEGMVLRG
jgi:hypothetical protein